jgi:hypothetical protein
MQELYTLLPKLQLRVLLLQLLLQPRNNLILLLKHLFNLFDVLVTQIDLGLEGLLVLVVVEGLVVGGGLWPLQLLYLLLLLQQ